MTTCPKCQSNKVTKKHFAVGDKVPLTEYYRGRQWEGSYWVVTEALIEFTCRDCGHQWAHPPTDAISGFRKQILKEAKARQELQTALGAKSQAAEVLMLEAAEKLKDIKYVAEQYKQAAHHAVEENQKLRDEVEMLRSWPSLDLYNKLTNENGKLKQQNEELTGALDNWAASEKLLKDRIKVHEDYEKQHHERLIDLVIKWRSDARRDLSGVFRGAVKRCADELEEQI